MQYNNTRTATFQQKGSRFFPPKIFQFQKKRDHQALIEIFKIETFLLLPDTVFFSFDLECLEVELPKPEVSTKDICNDNLATVTTIECDKCK
jgi:hypothetical protein